MFRDVRPRQHAPRAVAEARVRLRGERRGEQLDPDAATAGGNDDFVTTATVHVDVAWMQPVGKDEAGVMDRRPKLVGERERVLEAREASIAVHEDRVEPARRPAEDFALALRLRLDLQDLTDRTDDQRPRSRRIDALEQRDELEAQRAAAERKR